MENKSSKVNKHCSKCWQVWKSPNIPFYEPFCKMKDCNCHSPTPDTIEEADPQIKGRYTAEDQRAKKQDTEEQSKCCGAKKMTTEMYKGEKPWCFNCGKPFEPSPKNENEDWEKEFEKMLCNCGTSDFTNHGNLCGYRYYGQQNVNIKSFIKSLIEKQKAEFIEKIKEKIAEYEYHKDMIHCTCLGALKEYIDDLLTSPTKE